MSLDRLAYLFFYKERRVGLEHWLEDLTARGSSPGRNTVYVIYFTKKYEIYLYLLRPIVPASYPA